MVKRNAQNRPPQSPEESQNCEPTPGVRSVGAIQLAGSEYGSYPIGVSREDSREENTASRGQHSSQTIPGKIVGQLIQETEKQLAYYEQQADLLKERLQELKEIPIENQE